MHRFGALGHTLFPRLYAHLAPPAMHIAGLTRERSDDSDGNVFEPMSEWNTVDGDWRAGRKRLVGAALAGAALWAWRRA